MKTNRCCAAGARSKRLGAIIKEHREGVWSFILKLTRDPHVSDDLCQEVFIRALATYGTLMHKDKVKSWLFSIGYHVTVDWMRKNAADRRLLRGLHRCASPEAASGTPDEHAIRHEEARLARRRVDVLWRRVRKLPPHYREVIRLRYGRRLSLDRIAARTGIPNGNVKVRLHRARKMLIRQLEFDPTFFRPRM